jgi:hypothetical protein
MAFPDLVSSTSQASQDGSSVGNFATFGPFEDGTGVRFLILQDITVSPPKLRAFKSLDTGSTWSEQDAAGAPDSADDSGSPSPGIFNLFAAVRNSTAAVRDVYVVYWATDFTIRLVTFHMATGLWGAQIASTLGYLTGGQPSNTTGFGAAYRSTDNSVWMMFPSGQDTITPVGDRVSGAKCIVGGAWDVALTYLSPGPGTDNDRNYFTAGMVTDSGGAVHCFMTAKRSNILGASSILHRVIHADNSLSAIDVIDTMPAPKDFASPCYPTLAPGDVLLLAYYDFSDSIRKVARAAAGDAPAWSIETPADIQPASAFDHGLQSTAADSGLQYIFYTIFNGVFLEFRFVTSSGIGVPFGSPTLIASFDTSGLADISNSVATAFRVGAGSAGVAITMGYSPDNVNFGQGYWEIAAAPPPPPVPRLPGGGGGGPSFPKYLKKCELLDCTKRHYPRTDLRDYPFPFAILFPLMDRDR